MAYCEWTDVTDIITTTLDEDQINNIISESDAEIDYRIGTQTTGDKMIQKLSKLMSAIQVKTQQPTSMGAGQYRELHNPVPVWAAEIEKLFKLKKKGKMTVTSYQHIDEDTRYTEDPINRGT